MRPLTKAMNRKMKPFEAHPRSRESARKLRPRDAITGGLIGLCLAVPSLRAQTAPSPSRSVPDPGVITTRQTITPAGVQSVFGGRVFGVTFGVNKNEIWVLARTSRGDSNAYRLDWAHNSVRQHWELAGAPGLQGIALDPLRATPLVAVTLPAKAAHDREGGAVQIIRLDGESSQPLASDLGHHLAGAIAIARSPSANRALVPLVFDDAVGVVNVETGAVEGCIRTSGVAPFAAVISRDARTGWVSNWGGRWPKPGDPTLPTGLDPRADQVVVDPRGIASTGTVVRIDLDARKVTHSVNVGLHPTALVWDEPRERLYVANTNSDSISIVDTTRFRVAGTIPLKPFGLDLKGVAPTALGLSPDGSSLYVALGGFNAVAVLDVKAQAVRGFIPTAWYPNHVALSADGSQLAIATLLGVGSGWRDEPARRYVHAYRGSVSVLPVPDDAQLASYTTAVAENNRVETARERLNASAAAAALPLPLPRRAGDPSPIEHVVYIIKENRTYDQVFGDETRGNGDPKLVMFGREVTPNQHKLAAEFVLLDNFYATGGNSGDGHQWVTQANETSYALWPGYVGRSYPFDGTDPIAYASTGFLWDSARARGKSVRVYGEYAGHFTENDPAQRATLLHRWQEGDNFGSEWQVVAPLTPLNAILAKNYPPFSLSIPDVVRAKIFLRDVADWVKRGAMPNLVILQLPSDHTRGAAPGQSTPAACVADNDLALGQIVEGLSHTAFWAKMAIFVVEDDAQDGVDHVDGHRTVALAISPYVRRHAVDSTFYTHQSMVKSIELILGLPTLSLFDLIATDMQASFAPTADLRPYIAVPPVTSLFERNPALSEMRGALRSAALATLKMRFDVPDAAPSERLNRIVWGMMKGWNSPYPTWHRAVFAPPGE